MAPPGELATWQAVADPACAPLLDAIRAADDVRDAATLTTLRRDWEAPLVAVAIELVRAQRKAEDKFPRPRDLVADVEGVEQATSAVVAAHKAQRFGELSGVPVMDLCAGIGGDAMALAQVAEVTAVDLDPVRTWMAGHNASCATAAADVETMTPPEGAMHLDPARRADGRRRQRYADYRPGPACIERLLHACPDAAVKLGPGVELDALPGGPDVEVELVAEHGTLVQTILWSGRLARNPGARTATLLPEGATLSGSPVADPPALGGDELGALLFVPAPALERARLVGHLTREHPVRGIVDGLGLLTADEACPSPWLTGFEVHAQMPWREPKIRAWLAAHDGGLVEVKTRGGAIDTDAAQRKLRGRGDRPFTVFALRLGRKVVAVITSRS